MRRAFLPCLFLFLIFLFRFFTYHPANTYREGQAVNLVAVLSSQPQISVQSQRFEVERVTIITKRYPGYNYGDKLEISGILELDQRSVSTLPTGLLENKGIGLKLYFPEIKLLKPDQGNMIVGKISLWRQKLIAIYQEFLPEPASSLALGMILGFKAPMSPSFQESLRNVGLTHVVVASGLNITLFAGFLGSFFTLFFRRQLTLPLIFFGISFYALLAGFEPPVIRAALMGGLTLLGQTFGKQSLAVLTLTFVGLAMLIFDPILIFDLGFQLSFLATVGLVLVGPILKQIHILKSISRFPLLGESFLTTLGAQLAVLPLILSSFGYYSFLSLLANTLVLWTVPWVMGFGGLVGALGLIFKPLGQITAFIIYPFLFYFEKITLWLSRFDFLSFRVERFSLFLTLAYFSFLIASLLWLKRQNENKNET